MLESLKILESLIEKRISSLKENYLFSNRDDYLVKSYGITTGNFWRVVIRYVTEREITYLKENGLASTGKPSAAERIQQGIPSTSINLSDNRKIVNYFIIPPFKWYVYKRSRTKSLTN